MWRRPDLFYQYCRLFQLSGYIVINSQKKLVYINTRFVYTCINVDVSSTFIENIFRSGLTLVILEIVSVTKIKNKLQLLYREAQVIFLYQGFPRLIVFTKTSFGCFVDKLVQGTHGKVKFFYFPKKWLYTILFPQYENAQICSWKLCTAGGYFT